MTSMLVINRMIKLSCLQASFTRHLTTSQKSTRAMIGLGSNLGNRSKHITQAIDSLKSLGLLETTSFLYETPAMYMTDQPAFLNAVAALHTNLTPHQLLSALQKIENQHGRVREQRKGVLRYGPRPLDLDILLYGDERIGSKGESNEDGSLIVPHAKMAERQFVLEPLCDIDADLRLPLSSSENSHEAPTPRALLENLPDERDKDDMSCGISRVTPLRGETERLLYWGKGDRCRSSAKCMGIINTTPNSFSDGGETLTVESAVEWAGVFVEAGFEIVDIGGQSTAPHAPDVGPKEEMRRVVPVIEAVRKAWPELCISVDTFRAEVAREGLLAGADVVNDVSAGTGDDTHHGMQQVVGNMGAAWVLMHRRGDPHSMDRMVDYGGRGVVSGVIDELRARVEDVIFSQPGDREVVPRWMVWVDPGVGFAKTQEQSLNIMAELKRFKNGIGDFPVLIGPSRKRFVGGATGRTDAKDRDWATAGASAVAVMGSAEIIRIHHPRVADAVRFASAVLRSSPR